MDGAVPVSVKNGGSWRWLIALRIAEVVLTALGTAAGVAGATLAGMLKRSFERWNAAHAGEASQYWNNYQYQQRVNAFFSSLLGVYIVVALIFITGLTLSANWLDATRKKERRARFSIGGDMLLCSLRCDILCALILVVAQGLIIWITVLLPTTINFALAATILLSIVAFISTAVVSSKMRASDGGMRHAEDAYPESKVQMSSPYNGASIV